MNGILSASLFCEACSAVSRSISWPWCLPVMYDQTGSRVSLNNELFALEDIYCEQTLKSRSVKSFLVRIRRLDKYGRNKYVEISRKASTAHE